jgi:3-hydroxypropanoate dehydrogenase
VRPTLDDAALDVLFLKARTQNGWLPTPVSDDQLRRIYDIMKMGPNSANSCPARILFLRTPAAKARLLPALSPGNVDKTKQAPVTAIVGYDARFYERMPKKLFAHRPDMAEHYAKNPALTETVAFRNGTLRGAYFMLAARAVGLDVGGMSGFDNAQGRRRILRRRSGEVQLPVQPRPRRSRQSCRACRGWTSTRRARCCERARLLLEPLIGAQQQRGRDRQAEVFGRLEVDRQIVSARPRVPAVAPVWHRPTGRSRRRSAARHSRDRAGRSARSAAAHRPAFARHRTRSHVRVGGCALAASGAASSDARDTIAVPRVIIGSMKWWRRGVPNLTKPRMTAYRCFASRRPIRPSMDTPPSVP